MRPCENAAAASEPAAMPTAKKRLIAISTSTPPPMRDLTMTGTIDSVIAPIVQNQLTAIAPTHWRSSALSSRRMTHVARQRLKSTLRFGAPTPVAGMKSEAP
jgi:hypothetical protein